MNRTIILPIATDVRLTVCPSVCMSSIALVPPTAYHQLTGLHVHAEPFIRSPVNQLTQSKIEF